MKSIAKLDISRFVNISPRYVYLFAYICCLIVHGVFLFYFRHIGVTEMMYFNFFSVAMYLCFSLMLFRVKNLTPMICTALLEIIIHSVTATVYVGWGFGFAMFLVCVVPVPFFINFKKNITPYIITPVIVAVFMGLRVYTADESNVVYHLNDETSQIILYMFNSFFAFLMIIGISGIYKVSKQISQRQLKTKNETLSRLAAIDPLTQLFNRRAMMDFFKQIQRHAEAVHSKYIIAMGDIDNFKAVNDTYGHAYGDVVLKRVSAAMSELVPSEGYVCRWGGEELLFAVPNTGIEAGTEIAVKICEKLRSMKFCCGDSSFGVTITIGVCECGEDRSYEEGLKIADHYLYYGKRHGRNCVINDNNCSEDIVFPMSGYFDNKSEKLPD